MKYVQKLNNAIEAHNFKKHILAEADAEGHTYTVIYGEPRKMIIFKSSATPDKIIYECTDKNADSDTYNIINGLIKGKLLGDKFDYENDRTITQSDLNNVTNLGNVFAGDIKNKELVNSEYNIINFKSFENFTNVTCIDGIIDGEYQNFFGMISLEYINIPKSVTEIGNSAFAFCINLRNIKLHNNITAIKAKSFYNCASLDKIEIPESINIIENNAFNKCSNLMKIIIKSEKPCKIYKDSFAGIPAKCNIYVPKNSVDAYKAQWKNLADKIKGF
ncbi:MAG: hypothetical protein [Wendovervirus sonii]|uniref:Leucine-rich repeat domain-containing protein n=1 Tax=phage Lak_Megaphage_Sonny TaxID=3109229 RepID=A0ABZ0Z6H2_9CAUD|nr:MAG: hypothetical protein [phage Lak_Megaphage_Sonny]